MLRHRFTLLSVTAMIFATVLATLAVTRLPGAEGYAGHQGFPFAWYWWRDMVANNDETYGYQWGGLFLDVVIWFLAIIAFGFFVDYIAHRFSRKHESKNAA